MSALHSGEEEVNVHPDLTVGAEQEEEEGEEKEEEWSDSYKVYLSTFSQHRLNYTQV